MSRRSLYILCGAVIILVLGYWLVREVRQLDEKLDDMCDQNRSGSTTLNLRVLDMQTRLPLDSVRLIVRYGVSGDRAVDTVLVQRQQVALTFIVPETDRCETYWLELEHPRYVDELYSLAGDSLVDWNFEILKGTLQTDTVYVRPATQLKVSVKRNSVTLGTDTLWLSLLSEGGEQWNYYTESSFDQFPNSIHSHWPVASGRQYTAKWVRQHGAERDSVSQTFYAAPHDTVLVEYVFSPAR